MNAAYHHRVNPGLRSYRNGVITQRRATFVGIVNIMITPIKKMHIAQIFIHIYTLLYSMLKYYNAFMRMAPLF